MATITVLYRKLVKGYYAQIRFNSLSKSTYLSYKEVIIPSKYFNIKTKEIKRTCPDYLTLNQQLNLLKDKINQVEKRIRFKKISAEDIKELFLSIDTDQQHIKQNKIDLLYFGKFSSDLQSELKAKGKHGTAETYNNATSKLLMYLLVDIKINKLAYIHLIGFKNYCIDQGLSTNTISTYISKIRAIYNEACSRIEYKPEFSPFKKGLITYERTRKRNLNIESLQQLKSLNLKGSQERCRDLLLLSFYLRGLDIIDILTINKIENGYINHTRQKLGDKMSLMLSIKVEPEAFDIINKYSVDNSKYLLPFYKYDLKDENGYTKYKTLLRNIYREKNNILKEHKLDIELNFKTIRHSWATVARQQNVSYDIIQASLGHKNTDITDVYIEYHQDQLDHANRNIIDLL